MPFGRQSRVGFLIQIVKGSDVDAARLKSASTVLDETPLLNAADLSLLKWAARYYHHPLGEVFSAAVPSLLRKGHAADVGLPRFLELTGKGSSLPLDTLSRAPRQALLLGTLKAAEGQRLSEARLTATISDWRRAAKPLVDKGLAAFVTVDAAAVPAAPMRGGLTEFPAPATPLNAAQQAAVDAVSEGFGKYGTYLLEGVTGSGKTEVYLHLARRATARGEQSLLLLPEISLTPQIEQRFRAGLGDSVRVFHSRLTETERLLSWLALQRGTAPILLGTRSAVFVPMRRPGLIVIDEEHDPSYKQQDGFRYSARDVAIKRARELGIPILLGSATPSLESLWNAQRGRYRLLALPERAGGASQPALHLVDIRRQRLTEGLSRPLVHAMRTVLDRGQQVLLFINRRGYAPTLICNACGWVAECHRCDARLVIHRRDERLRCHYCAFEQALPEQCPDCGSSALHPLGLGTERIERALEAVFPGRCVLRIDRDKTARAGSLGSKLADVHDGEVDILIGTQMLAKGHHFPRVTLVGILDADAMLFATDFRAGERTAQLIVQVAGRAGRADERGRVVLQTRHPEHPLLRTLIDGGYRGFAAATMAERRAARLPPFGHLAVWRAEAEDAEAPLQFLAQLRRRVEADREALVEILGPAPAPMLRQSGRHRYQLLLQCDERSALHRLLDALQTQLPAQGHSRGVRWTLDIDPIDCY